MDQVKVARLSEAKSANADGSESRATKRILMTLLVIVFHEDKWHFGG